MIKKDKLDVIKASVKKFDVTHNARLVDYKRQAGKTALITITWHKAGKRVSLSKKLFLALGSPDYVNVSYTDEYLVFSDGHGAGYKVSIRNKTYMIYCTALTKAIIEQFDIDLTKHSTCSFYDGELCEDVFLVQMRATAEEDDILSVDIDEGEELDAELNEEADEELLEESEEESEEGGLEEEESELFEEE
ncbi:MAG: hypothetical protein E7261_06375 [Lachnospiraceae bacterium]|nr:hypothetical protein [Lachnospiraceae bacterium]